jgi:hypothetical protein
MNEIIVNKDYKDLYKVISKIFKDNQEVTVLFDKKFKEDKSNYKH